MKNGILSKRLSLYRELLTVKTKGDEIRLVPVMIPIFFEAVCSNLIGTVNTAVLSRYSEISAATAGTANTVIGLFPLLFTGWQQGLLCESAIGWESEIMVFV